MEADKSKSDADFLKAFGGFAFYFLLLNVVVLAITEGIMLYYKTISFEFEPFIFSIISLINFFRVGYLFKRDLDRKVKDKDYPLLPKGWNAASEGLILIILCVAGFVEVMRQPTEGTSIEKISVFASYFYLFYAVLYYFFRFILHFVSKEITPVPAKFRE